MNYKPRKSRKKNKRFDDGESPLSNLNFPAVSFKQSPKKNLLKEV